MLESLCLSIIDRRDIPHPIYNKYMYVCTWESYIYICTHKDIHMSVSTYHKPPLYFAPNTYQIHVHIYVHVNIFLHVHMFVHVSYILIYVQTNIYLSLCLPNIKHHYILHTIYIHIC